MNKTIIFFITIFFIDLILIGYFITTSRPDPSVSIEIIFIIPLLFVFNIVAGIVVLLIEKFVLKSEQLAPAIFANSIMSPIMYYIMFSVASRKNVNDTMTTYHFSNKGNNYQLILYLKDKSYRLDLDEGSQMYQGLFWGTYHKAKDTFYLGYDHIDFGDSSVKIKMYDRQLIGFPSTTGEIKLIKD